MHKPVQKKNSSWTPPKVQKKGKNPGKLGYFSIQPKPNQTSAPPQEIGEYSRASADRLAANVMRGLQAKEQEQARLDTNNPNQIWQRAQSITPVVQRRIDPRVQMRQMIQRAAQIDGNQASGDLESRLNASQRDRKNLLIQRFSWSEVTETAGQIGNTITDAVSSVGEQVERGVNYLTSRPERQRAERERPERERENPGDFCTPYSSRAEVYAAKTYLWTTLIPSATGKA